MNATDTERGWVASTLTHSGSFTKNRIRHGEKVYTYPRVEFYSKDEFDVDRLVAFTGYGRKTFRAERKNYGLWRWSVTKQEDVRDLAIEILPLLPEERRETVMRVL